MFFFCRFFVSLFFFNVCHRDRTNPITTGAASPTPFLPTGDSEGPAEKRKQDLSCPKRSRGSKGDDQKKKKERKRDQISNTG